MGELWEMSLVNPPILALIVLLLLQLTTVCAKKIYWTIIITFKVANFTPFSDHCQIATNI